jgi:hypothetical protein
MGEKTNGPDPAAGGARVAEGPTTTGGSTTEAPPSPYAGEAERKEWGPEGQELYDSLRAGSAHMSPKEAAAYMNTFTEVARLRGPSR